MYVCVHEIYDTNVLTRVSLILTGDITYIVLNGICCQINIFCEISIKIAVQVYTYSQVKLKKKLVFLPYPHPQNASVVVSIDTYICPYYFKYENT